MSNSTKIKEIFESIQGEGPYLGCNQLFIRFSKCNLHCKYCDTDFTSNLKEVTPVELAQITNSYQNIHSISLTGGEPLMDSDFLKEFLPLVNNKIYLETNGTLPDKLEEIIDFIDIISMDFKLDSCSNNRNLFEMHEKFIEIAKKNNKEIFAKTVFDENITEEEIKITTKLAKKYNIILVLQPKMDADKLNLDFSYIQNTYNKFIKQYENVRLIPQVHKFLNIR